MNTTQRHSSKLITLLFLYATFFAISCNPVEDFTTSPLLSPKDAIKKMELEEGFQVELVAAEPLLNSPTTMTFDEKGRMWVVEMPSFMLDTIGTDEEQATGKILILEDNDNDGIYETRKEFMDSLVLPRAISLIEKGILIAEPPYLWFVEIIDDRPGKKTLVDKEYAIGGNVEHQPNGLLRALDNWIYNAKSDKRYRKKGDEWIIEKTHFRGQWGIAQDNYGRLYYNHNSANVLGDYFLPGFGATNDNQRHVAGYSESIVPDNRVYPARPTTGVNRGYMEGILNDSLRLVNFTAASGLTVYRGDMFGPAYAFNAFVPEPAAYLIKRNLLNEQESRVEGVQAYEGKEFLRSTDERFRPVSLSNGPDGAMYIVDMHRGIIQHKTYLTDYLKSEIKARDLQQATAVGRIYRIVPTNGKREMVHFPNHAKEIASLLEHPNGWVRDKAQQLLIDNKNLEITPQLIENLKRTDSPLALIHSLWTLEGLGALNMEDVLPLMSHKDQHIKMQAFGVLPSILTKQNYGSLIPVLKQLISDKDSFSAPYIAFILKNIQALDPVLASDLSDQLLSTYQQNTWVASAVISNLKDREADFLKRVEKNGLDTNTAINKTLRTVLKDIAKKKSDINTKAATDNFPKGALIYKSTCATCHGEDGYGLESLAPTLNTSDWVKGNKDKVIATVLFGLTGPIIVNGETPKVSGDMPGVGQNPEFSDEDIAQIISYIRGAWSNDASSVTESDVKKIRNQFKDRNKAFTMPEVDALWKRP